jgi:hypothetical protein
VVSVVLLGADAEGEGLTFGGRRPERAAGPVPDGQEGAEVAVVVARVVAVVDLVLGGADDEVLGAATEGEPDVGVAEVGAQGGEGEGEGVDAEDLELAELVGEEVVADPCDQADGQRGAQHVQGRLHGVDAVEGERGQHLRGVVDLVQLPERAEAVHGAVQQVARQVVDDEECRGVASHDGPGGGVAGGRVAEGAGEGAGDLGDGRERGQHEGREQDGARHGVAEEELEVEGRRAAEEDAAE